MRHLGAGSPRAFGNIDADPPAIEDPLCDNGLDWTTIRAPSRHGTSEPVRHPYEARPARECEVAHIAAVMLGDSWIGVAFRAAP